MCRYLVTRERKQSKDVWFYPKIKLTCSVSSAHIFFKLSEQFFIILCYLSLNVIKKEMIFLIVYICIFNVHININILTFVSNTNPGAALAKC